MTLIGADYNRQLRNVKNTRVTVFGRDRWGIHGNLQTFRKGERELPTSKKMRTRREECPKFGYFIIT